jgi:hypothetical protein
MLRPRSVVFSLLLCAVLASPMWAQGWVDRTTVAGPGPSYDHAMCYDAGHNVSMMFRGGNTWTWDGTVWSQVGTNGPSSGNYTQVVMAYHAAANQVLLVPNNGSAYVWSGLSWSTVSAPPPQSFQPTTQAMAYDPVRTQTVLFIPSGQGGYASATFVWDGSSWSQRSTQVIPNGTSPSMAFDPVSGNLLLATVYNNATWFYEWTGTNWRQRYFASQPATPGAMASDGTGIVMLDGVISPTPGHTWTFAGSASTQLALPVEPTRRTGAQMVYDSLRNRFVLSAVRAIRRTPGRTPWATRGSSSAARWPATRRSAPVAPAAAACR